MQHNSSNDIRLCVCEMCQCGDHRCPQQTDTHGVKRYLGISKDADDSQIGYEGKKISCHSYDQPLESNLYSSSTYSQDFKVGSSISGPPETSKLIGTLKCEEGVMPKESTYSWDYVPWSVQDIKLKQSTLEQGGTTASSDIRSKTKGRFDALEMKPEVVQRLCNYYCPPHCLGNEKQSPTRNCLATYKDKFNLGPPSKKSIPPIEKPLQPFSKFTNYLLDYIPHKIQPRRNTAGNRPTNDGKRTNQTPFDTTHKKDYVCWSPDDYARSGREGHRPKDDDSKQKSTLKMGVDGPVVAQSSSMMDYRDPVVTGRMPSRPHKQDEFRLPSCRMETETTTGAAFPRWEGVPLQLKSKHSEETSHITSSDDARCFVTTYQQDFDDLREVLCPARVIEKYGRKILEPKYHYVGSGNEHEYYCCEKQKM